MPNAPGASTTPRRALSSWVNRNGLLAALGTGCPPATQTGSARAQAMSQTRKSKPIKRVPLSIYVPPNLIEQIRRLATRDRRSLSTETLIILEEALAKKE